MPVTNIRWIVVLHMIICLIVTPISLRARSDVVNSTVSKSAGHDGEIDLQEGKIDENKSENSNSRPLISPAQRWQIIIYGVRIEVGLLASLMLRQIFQRTLFPSKANKQAWQIERVLFGFDGSLQWPVVGGGICAFAFQGKISDKTSLLIFGSAGIGLYFGTLFLLPRRPNISDKPHPERLDSIIRLLCDFLQVLIRYYGAKLVRLKSTLTFAPKRPTSNRSHRTRMPRHPRLSDDESATNKNAPKELNAFIRSGITTYFLYPLPIDRLTTSISADKWGIGNQEGGMGHAEDERVEKENERTYWKNHPEFVRFHLNEFVGIRGTEVLGILEDEQALRRKLSAHTEWAGFSIFQIKCKIKGKTLVGSPFTGKIVKSSQSR